MAGVQQALLLALFITVVAFNQSPVQATISESMLISWGAFHASINGDDLELKMDPSSGSGAKSKLGFLFGSFEMQIKLVPGNSAGTVTAYYLTSTGDKHDEVDFEFIGNVSGQPYIIHTNVYSQGIGGRENQFYAWFDPTADFHNYTIHWNPTAIIWYIDSKPVRVFRNFEHAGTPFPNRQEMGVQCSLWNAESWATRGGLDKVDWNSSPFVAHFHGFRARACNWRGPESINQCTSTAPTNWYTSPAHSQLSPSELDQMNWVRENFMIYDYCKDNKRFNGKFPPECINP